MYANLGFSPRRFPFCQVSKTIGILLNLICQVCLHRVSCDVLSVFQKTLALFDPCLGKAALPDLSHVTGLFLQTVGNPPLMNGMAFSIVMPSLTVISRWRWFGMMTKSCRRNFPAATYERSTSIIKVALRSDCNKARPWLVLVVAKHVRAELRMFSGRAFRAGRAICRG